MADLPALQVSDIIGALDGVTNSKVDKAGTTKPLIECITSGVLRGAAVILGSDGGDKRPAEDYAVQVKKLIANDIIVLAIGYPVSVLTEFFDKSAAAQAGDGLGRVCSLADIPPVLPLGGLDNIQNVVTIASALSADSGLAVHQLPLVGLDLAGVSETDVTLGNTFAGLGVDTFIGVLPEISVSGLKDGENAKQTASADLNALTDALIADIEAKRAALGI